MFKYILLFLLVGSTTSQAQTALLGAFGEEVKLLQEKLLQKKEVTIQKISFTTGLLNGKQVIIAQTGVGKVNAAIVTTLLLEHFKPKAVLFTGIAGAINPQLHPGDLVIGTRIAYHDYGKLSDTMTVWNTQNNPLYFLSDTALVNLAQQQSRKVVFEKIRGQAPHIISGTIVTGDVFVAGASAAGRLRKQLQADATEMEGAAVAQVCWQQNTPFIVIRSISDHANDKAHDDATSFYKIAAHNSATLVMAMVNAFK